MEHKIKRSQEQHQWKEKIEELLKNMKYGNITIIVQDERSFRLIRQRNIEYSKSKINLRKGLESDHQWIMILKKEM